MSEHDEARLQSEVNAALEAWPELRFGATGIRLDNGSDMMELSRNVDMRVFRVGREEFQLFTAITASRVESLGKDSDVREPFTTGGPLIIVNQITGKSIVQAVMHYLMREEHRRGI